MVKVFPKNDLEMVSSRSDISILTEYSLFMSVESKRMNTSEELDALSSTDTRYSRSSESLSLNTRVPK